MLNHSIHRNEGQYTLTPPKNYQEKKYFSSEFCVECNINGKKCKNCLRNETISTPADNKVVTLKENEKIPRASISAPAGPLPKSKKNKPNYICTSHCKYDIVRQIASKFGMRESQENWNVLWSDYLVTCERVKHLRRYQKINHFPGMAEICRKDLLARNLNRMCKLFPKDYGFFPKTWLLPADLTDVTDFGRRNKNTTYILKPDIGCKGKGIQLTKNLKDLANLDRTISQVYVSKPYLIDGFKFDLRVYVLVTSCDPLRLYVYNEGLVRFATKRYKEPNRTNMTNMYMHLTNYSVNKFSRTYVADPEEGSKRKLTTLNEYLKRQYHDVNKLWNNIDDVIIKTILLALPTLQHNYKATFPSHRNRQACFELLGFDLILDSTLKPYLLEVNHSPSFHTDAPIDREVKEALIIDTFKILNLPKNIKNSVLLEDKRNVTNRLLKDLQSSPNPSPINSNSLNPASSEELLRKLELYEIEHCGNFRKIYPNQQMHLYSVFYCQGTSSLFNETFSSRARERVSKLMKEGIQESELVKLKPFEAIASLAKRPILNSPATREEICDRVSSHNKVREIISAHSNIPSLLHERKGMEEDLIWNSIYSEQNAAFLQKVHEYARNSKLKQEINKAYDRWLWEGNEAPPKRYLNRNCEVYSSVAGSDRNDSDTNSDVTEFQWDVHFRMNKNQYKIDSFPRGWSAPMSKK